MLKVSKLISMLTDLEVLSLAWKCVFCKPELLGKRESQEIEILSSLNIKMKYING